MSVEQASELLLELDTRRASSQLRRRCPDRSTRLQVVAWVAHTAFDASGLPGVFGAGCSFASIRLPVTTILELPLFSLHDRGTDCPAQVPAAAGPGATRNQEPWAAIVRG